MIASLKAGAKRLLPRNKFARSVSILAGGTAAGQGILIAASPLLTRLYTPEDFGLLAVFASLLAILGVITSLGYHLAIPLPERDGEAANVAALSLLIVLGLAILTTVIVIPCRHTIAEALNTPLLADYIWLLPLGLLLTGIYQVLNYWAIRVRAFPSIARTKLTQSISMVAVQVSGYAFGPLTLLLGRVCGEAAGAATLGSLFFSRGREALRYISPSGIRKASSRYYLYPLYSSWASLLNTMGSQVPPILFSIFYSANAAGLYILAHRVIALPMTLLGTAIADVFMPNAIEAVRRFHLKKSVASLQRQLAWIALPPAGVMFIIAPEAFRMAFGPDWEQAGHMVRWLTPMLFLQFIVSPMARIFMVLEQQKLGLTLQANLFLLRLVSLLVSWYLEIELLDAVLWYGIASALGYFAYIVVIASVTKNSLSAFITSWGLCIPWLMLVLAPLFGALYFTGSTKEWMEVTSLLVSLILLFLYYKRIFPRVMRPAPN